MLGDRRSRVQIPPARPAKRRERRGRVCGAPAARSLRLFCVPLRRLAVDPVVENKERETEDPERVLGP
jgi:hypothetical protein